MCPEPVLQAVWGFSAAGKEVSKEVAVVGPAAGKRRHTALWAAGQQLGRAVTPRAFFLCF